jgi:hypothetical protein
MRAAAFTVFFAVVVSAAPAAFADSVAMRAPLPGRGLVLTLGFPATELGFWMNSWIGIGVHMRVPASAVGTEIALRKTLVGKPRLGFGLEGLVAFGLDVPLLSPGFVATATASLAGRYFAPSWFVQVAATSPAAFRLTDPVEARVPILAEVWVGGRAQAMWIGAHIAGGVAIVPPQRLSPAVQLGLAMGLEL